MKVGTAGFQLRLSSVQLLSHVQLLVTPWTAACQPYLSKTNSRSLPKLMSIESVMPCNHLILCCPFLLPSSMFPSIRVFSNESVLHIRWQKCWSFSFSISLSSEYSGLISSKIHWLDLTVQGTLKRLLQYHSSKASILYYYLLSLLPIFTYRRRQWHSTPVLLPGKSHGRRSLVGCSPWGR